MTDRLSEIQRHLSLRAQGVDMEADWDELAWAVAEIARLRAAGVALVPHVVEEDAFMDTLYCGACRVTMSDDEDFVHAPDCPTRVFAEGAK